MQQLGEIHLFQSPGENLVTDVLAEFMNTFLKLRKVLASPEAGKPGLSVPSPVKTQAAFLSS